MDLAPLLAPITADEPGGADLSFSPEIDAIEEMRREDDPTLAQGEWVSALKSADWSGVARNCESILTTTSKDLRVTGWLVDAWARLRGFEGLADGLDLTAGLVDGHWKDLHPRPEDGDWEERIGNLRWLAARLEQLASTISLVAHAGRRTSLTALNGARARRLAGLAGASAHPAASTDAAAGEPPLTLETVWRDVTAGGRDAARARRTQVTRTRAALQRLETAVDTRLPGQAPSFVAARTAVDKALDELGRLERECGLTEAVSDAAAPGDDVDAGADTMTLSVAQRVPGQRPSGRIETRAQALEQLRQVAAFFRSTEPHSPVAYLADKAVRWSEMPLHEWLRAVVKDGVSLAHLEEMLGVETPPQAG